MIKELEATIEDKLKEVFKIIEQNLKDLSIEERETKKHQMLRFVKGLTQEEIDKILLNKKIEISGVGF
ncbi:MAG: hypothetical protein ACRC4M_05130 [Mycoplasma sp.]